MSLNLFFVSVFFYHNKIDLTQNFPCELWGIFSLVFRFKNYGTDMRKKFKNGRKLLPPKRVLKTAINTENAHKGKILYSLLKAIRPLWTFLKNTQNTFVTYKKYIHEIAFICKLLHANDKRWRNKWQ